MEGKESHSPTMHESPEVTTEYIEEQYEMYTLTFGRKKLELRLAKTPEGWSAEGLIDTVSDDKKEAETTKLYTEVVAILTQKAKTSHQPVTYLFTTANPQLIAWAQTVGNSLFHWETTSTGMNRQQQPTLTCTATFQ